MLRGTLERVPRTPQNFSQILYWRGCGGGAERGLAPGGGCAPARHWLDLPLWCPVGGAVVLVARLPCHWFAFLPPSPRPRSQSALPGGKGGNFSFLMQGASPLAFPRLNPRGAGEWGRITRPAGGVPLRGTCYPSPGGEDHLKRRSSSPPVPPLLGCRHCS